MRVTPPTPEVAAAVFGDRIRLAEAYVDLLAGTGISHGLIGPREAPRLWERHVLNSAVVHPVFDHDSVVADLGSGAGLPGIPLAIVAGTSPVMVILSSVIGIAILTFLIRPLWDHFEG